MKRVIIHDYWGSHVGPWLHGLIAYLEGQGTHVLVITRESSPKSLWRAVHKQRGPLVFPGKAWLKRTLARTDHVFMWNGEEANHALIRKECANQGIPCSILEVGYFPQKSYFTIDPIGINGTSALMRDNLEWVGPKELKRKEALQKEYLEGRFWAGGGDYILVPLQLKEDTNIKNNSDFSNMQEVIHYCENRFPDENILFKKHPEDSEEYETKHVIVDSGDFLDLAMNAKMVVGVNSTCLLESTMLGVPTESLGRGFLSAHGDKPAELLAALVDKQIPINALDMSHWLNRYCAEIKPKL